MKQVNVGITLDEVIAALNVNPGIDVHNTRWPGSEYDAGVSEVIQNGLLGEFVFYHDDSGDDEEDVEYRNTFVGLLLPGMRHNIQLVKIHEGRVIAYESEDLYMDDEATAEDYAKVYNNRSYIYDCNLAKIVKTHSF